MICDSRFRHQVHRIHRLGERALGELLIEVGADTETLDRYAALDPDVLVTLGADPRPTTIFMASS